MLRKYFLATLLFICSLSQAQLSNLISKPPSADFSKALNDIILDFRFNFQNIQGEMTADNGSSKNYISSVQIPGSLESLITTYSSSQDTTSSFSAVMYKGESQREAFRKYSEIFRQVKHADLHWVDHVKIYFAGDYEKPDENIRFASSTLSLDVDDDRYKRFRAEIELVSTYDTWEVRLNLETKKNDWESGKEDAR